MQTDPMEEWRRLSKLYSEMGDIEMGELAAQINDLTPNAQQALRDELKKRGMNEVSSDSARTDRIPADAGANGKSDAQIHWEPSNYTYAFSSPPDEGGDDREYTWKTELCLCDSAKEAWRIGEVLRRAGIDSWIQGPDNRAGLDGSRVLVAADQLDQARVIAAQPVPQDVIEESNEPEDSEPYENPRCPKCHAADPTLESVEPSNNWLCESCGYAWSDPISDGSGAAESVN